MFSRARAHSPKKPERYATAAADHKLVRFRHRPNRRCDPLRPVIKHFHHSCSSPFRLFTLGPIHQSARSQPIRPEQQQPVPPQPRILPLNGRLPQFFSGSTRFLCDFLDFSLAEQFFAIFVTSSSFPRNFSEIQRFLTIISCFSAFFGAEFKIRQADSIDRLKHLRGSRAQILVWVMI